MQLRRRTMLLDEHDVAASDVQRSGESVTWELMRDHPLQTSKVRGASLAFPSIPLAGMLAHLAWPTGVAGSMHGAAGPMHACMSA